MVDWADAESKEFCCTCGDEVCEQNRLRMAEMLRTVAAQGAPTEAGVEKQRDIQKWLELRERQLARLTRAAAKIVDAYKDPPAISFVADELFEELSAARVEIDPPEEQGNFDTFQIACARTWFFCAEEALNAALGIAGEAGEIVEHIKKERFHGKELSREDLKLELGDLLYYVATLARIEGFTLSEVAAANVAKLRARYPHGFVKTSASSSKCVCGHIRQMHSSAGYCVTALCQCGKFKGAR
jgi:NTP pyrophosphatase (non-canonical NTP hydrolase)